ncbi:MAG: hypothetical protein IT381_08385 [Deltaproteobacteria bacterium]|nr:hypothetical protein [Deltaproteobacteria bacterium]
MRTVHALPVFLLACAGLPQPVDQLVTVLKSDGALVSPHALRLHNGDASALDERRFAHACLQAGARGPCERFAATLAPERRERLLALIALQFSEPAAVEGRLLATSDGDEARVILSLELARYYVRQNDDVARAKATAALAAVAMLDGAGAYSNERALIHIALAIQNDELASAHKGLKDVLSASAALDEKNRDELVRLSERLIAQASDHDKDATDQARRLFADMNRLSPDEAVAAAAELADKYPETNALWIALGLARLKAGDEPGAVLAFERARIACPFDPEADFQLARLHERRARYARAVYYLERGIEAAPAWTKGLWLLADLAMLAREPERASQALTVLKRLYPGDVTVDLGRARALLERDDGLRAMAILKETTRNHPTDLRPALALAKAALTLHGRAQSPEGRARMVSEAEAALSLAKNVAKDHNEVLALQSAVAKLKEP